MENISVSVRVHPLNAEEQAKGASWAVACNEITHVDEHGEPMQMKQTSYKLDNVFGTGFGCAEESSTQLPSSPRQEAKGKTISTGYWNTKQILHRCSEAPGGRPTSEAPPGHAQPRAVRVKSLGFRVSAPRPAGSGFARIVPRVPELS
eukprot:CAMPEP_0182882830 /NCGR_PEP_ID=MMETSP0034_2-20130328/18020_1 /TAXON_ID=156128 /ORGANISM="Nephroselmis pyriformis, Strain CCMP717" /LENGTH=147 /DNA_ID=CAMNT_0025015943 /DNA_START=242 /DNA_END=686 /DNA_ORIENTATION=-